MLTRAEDRDAEAVSTPPGWLSTVGVGCVGQSTATDCATSPTCQMPPCTMYLRHRSRWERKGTMLSGVMEVAGNRGVTSGLRLSGKASQQSSLGL